MRCFFNYIDPLLYIFVLFAKAWIFSCAIDPSLITSIANHELFIMRLSINYFASVLFLTAFAYFIRSKVWCILLLGLTDIWLIANLIYFRSYNDLLNSWCFYSISNLSGFETAVWTFFEWSDLSFVALSLLYGICAFFLRNYSNYKTLYTTLTCFLLGLVLSIPQMVVSLHEEMPCNPYDKYYHDVSMGRNWYCITFSPYKYFMNELLAFRFFDDSSFYAIDDDAFMQYILPTNTNLENVQAPYNVVIVFFESLENWTTGLIVDGEEITPNLNRFSGHPHTCYLELVSQVAQGMSSDAQLIVLAGLLPIENGAASMRFPTNTYLTLPKSCTFSKTQMFVPTSSSCWNQAAMCKAFGFQELFAMECSDYVLFDTLCNVLTEMKQPAFLMAITMASHSPFTDYADYSHLQLKGIKNTELKNYLRCVNYTDSCLGYLMRQITASPLSENTIMLIMGDHTIFYPEKRERFFQELSCNDNPQFPKIPAFIYTPCVNTILPWDTAYQMDVYPTILALLNKQYLWQGVGKNLKENTPRKIASDSASFISNSIIQHNFFQRFSPQ